MQPDGIPMHNTAGTSTGLQTSATSYIDNDGDGTLSAGDTLVFEQNGSTHQVKISSMATNNDGESVKFTLEHSDGEQATYNISGTSSEDIGNRLNIEN